ncbi:phosphatidate cytidylyltransferase [Wenzhouxiangella sp. XN79A]|uniref:phosphatidate cytidylyltransferase n=1 Tax=Wenzhouxiangella sp. XN79A TaxID=2724193 RepID=UPI00144AB678|nr:phosphatidate cytidylyltransferase [Wenzhouxiangella sp. XN79A]NKI35009.1 phosphatidate cytidylyltransferase [Wenzhouxiangella sp. XN79A]
MLRSRVLTSLVLAAVLLGAIFGLSTVPLTLLLALLVLVLGGWEGAGLAGLQGPVARVAWILVLLAGGAGLVLLTHERAASGALFALGTLFWVALCGWLAVPERGRPHGDELQPTKLAAIGAILLFAFIAFAWLHVVNPWLLLALLLIIAAADIGAYFTGHAIGGTRLAPRISPGKTRSGALGGIAAAGLAGLGGSLLPDAPYGPAVGVLAGLALALLSIGGDLTISLMKRHRGLKDTSRLLPGHGGILDRIDSLGAAAPAYALLVWLSTAGAG